MNFGSIITNSDIDLCLAHVNWCKISSAVSTVVRGQSVADGGVTGAEHCGYGDLH